MNDVIHLETQIKMPLLKLPVRTTYIQIDGKGILYSPGTRLSQDQLRSLPQVDHLFAPNLYHLGGIPKAKNFFKNAKVWGPKGAREKRPDIQWDFILGENEWPFEKDLSCICVDGAPSINESVLYLKSQKLLVTADLCFNLLDAKGFGALFFFKMFGTYRRFAVSRSIFHEIGQRQKSFSTICKNDYGESDRSSCNVSWTYSGKRWN